MKLTISIKYTRLILLIFLLLSACSKEDGAESEVVPTGTPVATVTLRPTATPRPTSIPTPIQTPTPEPIIPAVSVEDQVLDDEGLLVVNQVIAAEPGWLVVYTDEDGEADEILGYTAVEEGENLGLTVTVDPLQASPIMQAILHNDGGETGVFEETGPDGPIRFDSEIVSSVFEVEIQVIIPAVTASDQVVTEDGIVTVESVVAATPGWLVLHLDEDGEPGPMLGFAPVTVGQNENVTIAINWREATPILHAVLYEDAGEPEHFEYPDVDSPVLVQDKPITSAFVVMLPPDVYVLDQPVVDRSLVIERAISYGPGWLAVYLDDEGALGQIIGWAPLENGVNEQIVVTLNAANVTPDLHLMIHEDVEPIGEFGFPGSDNPILFQGLVPNPTTFRSDAGNYLITRDQELSADNTVTVPLVVVDVDAWVVLRADEDGQPGEIVGMAWIPSGINREIALEVDPELVTPILHAILYLDAGTAQVFEFPDGFDVPLQRNRTIINAPFSIQPE